MVDYSAINAAARTGTSGLSINDRQEASRASLADSEQTFLKLMTTQLKNQDPPSPVDSNAFTQQIVQMTGVEQQLLTNDLLKVLVGMNDGGISGQVGLIGKEVTTTSTTGTLADKSLTFDYNLPRAAGALKLEVVDAAGKTVATINPTDLSKGARTFKWDGKDSTGAQLPDGGVYSLKVTATDSAGTAMTVASTASTKGVVTAVSLENGQQMVTVNGRKILASDIVNVSTPPPATETASTGGSGSTNTNTNTATNTNTTPSTGAADDEGETPAAAA